MKQIELIRSLEDRAGIVGLSMAEVCRRAGIAKSTPSRWKSRKVSPTLRKLQKIEDVIAAEERAVLQEKKRK